MVVADRIHFLLPCLKPKDKEHFVWSSNEHCLKIVPIVSEEQTSQESKEQVEAGWMTGDNQTECKRTILLVDVCNK